MPANRQIEALKGAVIGLQKVVSEMQATQGGGRREEGRSARREGCCAGAKDARAK